MPKKGILKLHNYTKRLYHLCFISSTFGKYLIEYNEMLGMTKKNKTKQKTKNQRKTKKQTNKQTKNRMSPHNKKEKKIESFLKALAPVTFIETNKAENCSKQFMSVTMCRWQCM